MVGHASKQKSITNETHFSISSKLKVTFFSEKKKMVGQQAKNSLFYFLKRIYKITVLLLFIRSQSLRKGEPCYNCNRERNRSTQSIGRIGKTLVGRNNKGSSGKTRKFRC